MFLSKNRINPYRRKLHFSSNKREMMLVVLNTQLPKAARFEQSFKKHNTDAKDERKLYR
jgi:hypothetical protein